MDEANIVTKLDKVKKWVRENGGNGWSSAANGNFRFVDQFHGLRKILGMPTSEKGICKEQNEKVAHH